MDVIANKEYEISNLLKKLDYSVLSREHGDNLWLRISKFPDYDLLSDDELGMAAGGITRPVEGSEKF